MSEGDSLGDPDGLCDGIPDGGALGDTEGVIDGESEGKTLGLIEGLLDGKLLGLAEGSSDGRVLGPRDGMEDSIAKAITLHSCQNNHKIFLPPDPATLKSIHKLILSGKFFKRIVKTTLSTTIGKSRKRNPMLWKGLESHERFPRDALD